MELHHFIDNVFSIEHALVLAVICGALYSIVKISIIRITARCRTNVEENQGRSSEAVSTSRNAEVSHIHSNLVLSPYHLIQELDFESYEELSTMVKRGKKLAAIRFIHERKIASFREAKEIVDTMEVTLHQKF